MAIGGVLFGGGILPQPTVNPDARTRTDPRRARTVFDGAQLYSSGVFSGDWMAPALPQALPGSFSRSFFDDYYGRVYFLPASLDFGAIGEDTILDVRIWNAQTTDTVLQSVLASNDAGLLFIGPALPKSFAPLEIQTYRVQAGLGGPIDINAQYDFTFGTGQEFELDVTGSRATLSPLQVSWGAVYKVQYSYLTDIITSRDGSEQRRALRTAPRKRVSHQAVNDRANTRAFSALMAKSQNEVIIVPEETRFVRAAENLAIGVSSLVVDRVPPWLAAGLSVILSYGTRRESVSIASVDTFTRTVGLSAALVAAWPASTKLKVALAGRYDTRVQLTAVTSQASTVAAKFDVTPGSETYPEPPAPPQTFEATELVTRKPNWARAPRFEYTAAREEVDFGYGRRDIFTPVDFNTLLLQADYLGRDLDQAQDLLDIFHRAKGQRGEFFMPTWMDDFTMSQPTVPGSSQFFVEGSLLLDDYAESTVYRCLYIQLSDGTYYARRVLAAEASGAGTAVQLGETWGQAFAPEDVDFVCWLIKWRFATDNLTMDWPTDSVAQCRFSLRSLESAL